MLAAALPRVRRRDLTYFLSWDDERLPRYGADVVAILAVSDDARTPAWSHRVRATFKAGGVVPEPVHAGLRDGPLRAAGTAYLEGRVVARHLRGVLPRLAYRARHRGAPPVVAVPLGYLNQVEVPLRPIAERRWAITWAGSVRHWEGWWGAFTERLGSPKVVARREMLAALDRLAERRPDLPVLRRTLPSFTNLSPITGHHDPGETQAYSRLVADTRILLAPRGTNAETFRMYEGMRAGCVVVTDALPRRPYLRGAPVVVVDRWDRLDEHVLPLLDDPARLAALGDAALAFWRRRLAEDVVGRGMAAILNELDRPT
ncbi:MAG: hypothetical protein HZB46_01230 [Solirubrobacterales bacterium]|nr:hypothetical protein [Solirubrobacterales bacterium]